MEYNYFKADYAIKIHDKIIEISGGIEFGNECRRGANAQVEFAQRVVVNQVELHVFIAAAFARRGVGLAQQVQLRTLILIGLSRWSRRFRLWLFLRSRRSRRLRKRLPR